MDKSTSAKYSCKISLPSRPSRSKEMANISPLKLVSNQFSLSFPKKEGLMICIYSIQIEPNPIYAPLIRKRVLEYAFIKLKEDIHAFSFSFMRSYSLAFNAKAKQLLYKINVENVIYVLNILKIYEKSWYKLEVDSYQDQIISKGINHWISQFIKKLQLSQYLNTNKFFNRSQIIMNFEKYYFQVCKGMKTSFEIAQGGPRLLIDYCTVVIGADNVLTKMNRLGRNQAEIRNALIGKAVLADYGSLENYRITDVIFTLSPNSSFSCNGKFITYVQYFKNNYHIDIINKNQPLLLVIPFKKRIPGYALYNIHLIPELCRTIGLVEDEDIKFMDNIKKKIFDWKELEPDQRIDEITRNVNSINQELKRSDSIVQIEEFKTINAHQINVPQLTLGKKEIIKPDDKGSFMLRSKILEPIVLDYWILLYSAKGARDEEEAENFYNNLAKVSSTFGIKVVEPLYVNVGSIQGNDYAEALEKNIDNKVQAVIAFIPKLAKEKVYKPFKKACSLSANSIPSQVVLTSSVIRNSNAICSKIILQIAAKMGSSLWSSEFLEGMPKNIMVIGVDFFENAFDKRQFCIGCSASFDPNITKYYSRVKFVNKFGKDKYKSVCDLVFESIKNYLHINKVLPDIIIFYRTKTQDSDFLKNIINFEILEIKKAFKILDEKYNPQFIEVAVTQRVSTRFFIPSKDPTIEKTKYCYPPSGTVVMEEENSKNYNFYLYGLGKICLPTQYEVLCNDSNLTEDMLVKFTYYQCFGYYNWMGAIRIPACLRYATKLAQFTGTSLNADSNEKLWKKLHFL